MQKSYSQQVGEFTVSHRKLLLLIASLISLVLASGILRTSFDASLEALLSRSDPYLDEVELLEEEFPSAFEVNFAFVAIEDNSVFAKNVLAAISDLREGFAAIPFAVRLTSLIDYYSPEKQQRLFVNPLTDYSQEQLDALRSVATSDRLLTANLLSLDATLTFAIVTLDAEGASNQQRMEIATAVLQLRDDLRAANPEVGIHVNGNVLLEQSSQQAMIDDLTNLMPFVILVCVLVICFCFKSAWLGVCILTHTIFTILCTVGALGYLGYSFNSISIIAPLVVVIISVANSVHIISIYKQFLHKGDTSLSAMRQSVTHNFQPITLAAVTTAIGFSSLNMCSSPAIREFGQIVAIGIGFAYVLTLAMLPALLIRFSRAMAASKISASPFMHETLDKLSEFTARRDKAIFWSCSAFAVVTILLLPLNETDFDRLDFIATDSDIRQYYTEVGLRLNRGPALSYGIDTGAIDGAIEPSFLRRVDEFHLWLQQQANVESVASVVDVVKTVNRVQHGDNPEFYRLPADINITANHLNAYETVQSEDFPLSGFINSDFSMISLFVNATPLSNQELIDLDLQITDRFREQFPDAELIHGSGVLLFARMDELVTIELLQGYSISLLLITLSLIVGLRSVYFGILSVLPNLLPATMVFGLWALFVGQLDPFVMMLFSISIGLVVDDTVHILSYYLKKRRAGFDTTSSINYAIKTAGPALTITTLVLAMGTTILIGANTLYFQQAAKLLVPIVILALVLDLLYLPTILQRFDNRFKSVSP